MANTIADVTLEGSVYQDIYAATSIATGTTITIQNKTNDFVRIQVNSSQPSASSKNGYALSPLASAIIDGTPSGVWCFGVGNIMVQAI